MVTSVVVMVTNVVFIVTSVVVTTKSILDNLIAFILILNMFRAIMKLIYCFVD